MFWNKKKECDCGSVFMASVMQALGIYIGIVGVRLHLMSYHWLTWEALIFYFAAVLIFGWGKHIGMCAK